MSAIPQELCTVAPSPASRDVQVHVQALTSFAHLELYAHEARQLMPASPLQSLAWLESWWQAYGAARGQRLLLLGAFAAGSGRPRSLVGLAPCYIRDACGGAAVRLLGDGRACSDHATLLCTPGYEAAVADAVADWLLSAEAPQWQRVEWEAIDATETRLRRVVAQLGRAGMLVTRRQDLGSCVVELPDDWEKFLHTLSKNQRKRCRRWERSFLETGEVRVEVVADLAGCPAALDRLAKLHAQRRARLGCAGSFAAREFERFHRQVSVELARRGWLQFRFLVRGDEDLAAEYVLDDGEAYYAYQSGMSAAGEAISAGSLSLLALFRDAIAAGRRRVDLLRGVEPYKFQWGARRLAAETLIVRRPTLGGYVRAGCDAVRNYAAQFKRRGRRTAAN